jgi:hypothetical protein
LQVVAGEVVGSLDEASVGPDVRFAVAVRLCFAAHNSQLGALDATSIEILQVVAGEVVGSLGEASVGPDVRFAVALGALDARLVVGDDDPPLLSDFLS